MANICRKCGKYLQDTDTFCDRCGTPVYSDFNPAKKSHAGLIIALVASSVAILTTVILLFVAPGFLVKKKDKKNGGDTGRNSSTEIYSGRTNTENTEVVTYYTTEQSTTVTEQSASTTEQTTATPNTQSTTATLAYTVTEATSESTTEATTAATTQATTEATTQATTQASTQQATTEATTQAPPVDDSKPDFEKYGIRTDLPLGGNMDIIGRSTDGYEVELRGKVSVDAFTRTGVSEEVMAFGKENNIDFSGYEELRVRYHAFFEDTRLFTIGLTILPCSYDYYNVKLYEDTKVTFTDSYDEQFARFTIKYNGQERNVYRWVTSNWNDYNNEYAVYDCEIIYYVPAGYDGIVYGFRDPSHSENGYIYDNYDSGSYQLFRLK